MATKLLSRKVYYPGDRIFEEGDPGEYAYLIQSGRVRIEKRGKDGKPFLIGHVEPGGLFGEMALLDSSVRMAAAVADETTTCVRLTKETLVGHFKTADPLIKALIQVMLRNIRTSAAAAAGTGDKVLLQ